MNVPKLLGYSLLQAIGVLIYAILLGPLMEFLETRVPQTSHWVGPIFVLTVILTVGILFFLIFYRSMRFMRNGKTQASLLTLLGTIIFLCLETAISIAVLMSLPTNYYYGA
jgi:ABC-type multidrug transport system permease subunit